MTSTTALPPPAPPRATSTTDIIAVSDVTKTFDDQVALDHIDLQVPPGVIVGVIGPSGCGKTTLIRHLTGITAPTSGEVRVFGSDPTRFGVRDRTRFGYMPQLPVLFPNLTIWGNLTFISSVYGMPVRHRKQHLTELLDLVDLAAHRKKRLADCSGGMQRRLTLAATLVHDPELLFLDEPTAGVDPILRDRFWTHFRSLRDLGKTIVVPTQYVGEAVSCDVVAVMAHGRIITMQTPAGLTRFAFGGDPVLIPFADGWVPPADLERMRTLPFVRSVQRNEHGVVVVVDAAEERLATLDGMWPVGDTTREPVSRFEPTFDEIFVKIIEANPAPAAVTR